MPTSWLALCSSGCFLMSIGIPLRTEISFKLELHSYVVWGRVGYAETGNEFVDKLGWFDWVRSS
jgi:hypothetical protein